MAGELIETIKQKIIDKFVEQKTALFLSNGTIYGRSWKDLSPDYKKEKEEEIGRIYPMNILFGTMLESLTTQSLVIQVSQTEITTTLTVDVDSVRMNLEGPKNKKGQTANVNEYTDAMNEMREFISFSDEEKHELVLVAVETIKEYFGVV